MNKSTLLYQIDGNNIAGTSYLFGTMHVRDRSAFRAIDRLEQYIQSCNSFAAEFDLNDADMMALERASTLPEGRAIGHYINPSIYQKLAKVFGRETGLQLDLFQYRSPIIIINMIAEAQFRNDEVYPLDHALYRIAKSNGKLMLGLETFEDQLQVFSKLSIEEQARTLKKIATHFSAYRQEIIRAEVLYRSRDIQKLYKKTKKSIGSMRKVLLYDRNQTMVHQFMEFAQHNSIFAAVGAGHLAGAKGMLRLLKQKGYQVRPVYYDEDDNN